MGGGDGTRRTWGGHVQRTRAARTRKNRTRRREVAEAPRDAGGMRMQRRSSSAVAVECLAWAGMAGIKERERAGVSAPRSARSANPCSGTCRLAARSRSPPQPSVRGSPACVLCAPMRFAPCVVRAFFYAFMYTGGSPSTRNKGQAQLPACATHRRPAVAPAATGAMDTFIDMYQTLRDMRKRQLAHQVLSPHSAPLATCRRRLPLACAGIKRRRSAAARDLCALSTLSSCDPPQVLNLAMIVCSALMIWKVTRSYTCIHT